MNPIPDALLVVNGPQSVVSVLPAYDSVQVTYATMDSFCGPRAYGLVSDIAQIIPLAATANEFIDPQTVALMTTDQSLAGQTIVVTLTVQLVNYPMVSTTASFNVLVTANADCSITTISFQDNAAVFSADFNKVTNWTLTPATDSYSLMMADPMLCGPTVYTIAENYSWLSVVEVG